MSARAPVSVAPVVRLKYADQIRRIENCPPPASRLKEAGGVAFRFAYADRDDRNNFLPIALITPGRMLPDGLQVKKCCACFSLSHFQTLTQLKSAARKGLSRAPNFLKKVGDHFFEVALTAAAGVCTEASGSGHFELFEYQKFDLSAAVARHEPLLP